MKELFHKVFIVALALMVLMSTLSFTIEKHYCGDILVDTAVFSNAEKCGMEMVSKKTTKPKPCCKDEVDVIKGQDKLKFSFFEDLEFQKQLFSNTFTLTYLNLFESLAKQTIPHKDYSPPNLIPDIQLLDQVFII